MNQDLHKFNNIFKATRCLAHDQMMMYVKNQLTGKELREVEMHLADCEICSDMVQGIEAFGADSFEETVQELHLKPHSYKAPTQEEATVIAFPKSDSTQSATAPAKGNRNFFALFSIAAAFVFLIGCSYIFLYNNSSFSSIADEYYIYEVPRTVRGALAEESALQSAKDAIKHDDFTTAITLLKDIQTSEALFWTGQCHFKLGSYLNAKNAFKLAAEKADGEYADAAQFNLGVTYLKLDQGQDAKIIFEQVAGNPKNIEQSKAVEILKELEAVK